MKTVSIAKHQAENMIGRQTHNTGFYAVPAPSAVQIDGCFAEWDMSGQISSFADADIQDIFSVKTAAMWDETYLYLAFAWRDPYPMYSQVNPLQDKTRGWTSDSVQLRVLADEQPVWITLWPYEGDKSAVDVVYLEDRFHMDGDTENSTVYYTGAAGQAELGGGIAMAYRLAEDGKGFYQEVRLPWSLLYKKEHMASAGEKIRLGMEFQYGNPGGSGWPLHTYSDNLQPGKTTRSFFWTAVDSWGDLTLLDHSVENPRQYREESDAPQGTIPLRCRIPADAKTFTLTVNTQDGRRVRNVAGGFPVDRYTIAAENGEATVEVFWDCLDEMGDPVEPGTYILSGITAGGIEGYYETSFYNPGTPAWQISNTTGAWGADHTIPHRLAAAGDGMVVCSQFAEGGYGTFVLETAGENSFSKRWSEIRGTNAVAANEKYVFIVPNDWSASGIYLLRMHLSDGSFAPFVQNGKELPMPYSLTVLFGCTMETLPTVVSMTCAEGILLIRCSDNTIRAIDPENGVQSTVYPIHPDDGKSFRFSMAQEGMPQEPETFPMVSDGKTVWYYADTHAYRLDLKTGADMPASVGTYGKVVSIARDREGYFYIADAVCAQIIKCDEEGREYLRIGKPGGRARQGKYDPLGFAEISDMAVDNTGRIWVAEKGSKPRRLSVWNPDGSFCREYIGNAGYAGQGTFLHSQNPDKACAELNEMVYDRTADRWRVENIMYNPDPAGGVSITPGYSDFDSGNMFYSDASGEEKEYFAVLGMPRTTSFFLMVKEQDLWKPVSAVCTVADLQHLLGGQYNARIVQDSYGEWAENDPADVLFWNDYNNDGYVTKDECVMIPSPCRTYTGTEPFTSLEEVMPFYSCCCSSVSPADLSFLGTLREQGRNPIACLVKPVRFRDGGKPVYLPEGICPITDKFALWGSAAQLPAKNLVIGFIRQNDQVWVAGSRRDTGEILWKHRSPYHQVHGSHNAPMPKPGMLIGCLKIAGIAEGCGDSDVFMIRGNLGEDYFLTTDGMYINTLTRDSRLPGVAFPEDAESLRKVSFSRFTGRCEHFSGVFVRQADGVIRCSGGLPASQAGNIIRVEGLDTVQHIGQSQIHITADVIRDAMQANQERTLAARTPLEPIRIISAGEGWESAPVAEIKRDGQRIHGTFRAMYSQEGLYLYYKVSGIRWVNGGNNWRLLFKTGDCLDFQCSPGSNQAKDPQNGDFRLLIAPYRGGNAVVLMKQRDDKSNGREECRYSSPVTEAVFDTVRWLSAAVPVISAENDHVTAELFVSWELLEMDAPVSGTVMTGDVGIIGADAEGSANAVRIYRSNPCTNLVNDQPGEAVIQPEGFDRIQFI